MARSGGRTPRSVMTPDEKHLRRDRGRRPGVDVHADVPCRHARNMAVEHVLYGTAVLAAADRHAKDLVLVPRPCCNAGWSLSDERQQDVTGNDRLAANEDRLGIEQPESSDEPQPLGQPARKGNLEADLADAFRSKRLRQRRQLRVQRAGRRLPSDWRGKRLPFRVAQRIDESQRAAR